MTLLPLRSGRSSAYPPTTTPASHLRFKPTPCSTGTRPRPWTTIPSVRRHPRRSRRLRRVRAVRRDAEVYHDVFTQPNPGTTEVGGGCRCAQEVREFQFDPLV